MGSRSPGGVGTGGVQVGSSVRGQTGKGDIRPEWSQLNLLLEFSLPSKFGKKHFLTAPSASTGCVGEKKKNYFLFPKWRNDLNGSV